MSNPLEYNDHWDDLPSDKVFKFSPSKFSKFIQEPHNWYRSEILKEDEFTHSTSTVIGTLVHYCAEMVAKEQNVDRFAMDEYIDSLAVHENYNPDEVRQFYVAMAERLVNDYVMGRAYQAVEEFMYAPLGNGYYVAGVMDRIEGDPSDTMIVDYKTYNSKTKPRAIPQHYRYQLLVYAWILRQNGYNPTRGRLVYVNRYIDGGISDKTGKPLKSYPPEVTELTETFTEEDFDFIESQLWLAVDSIEASKAHPELTHVIWHDPRLKVA